MSKALKIEGKAAARCPAMEPFAEFIGVFGWKLTVALSACKIDDSLGPKATVKVIVEKDFGK
jgi:hypothetical protein